jgi:O-acetylhomoserine (thiol)-lyase
LVLLRDLGAVLSPFNSWVFLSGIETLSLRIFRHSQNALKIAEFLSSYKYVKKVKYPFLKTDENFPKAKKYLKAGSGLLSFETKSYELAKNVFDNVKIFRRVTNIGDSRSLITHPASTTHQQLSKEELTKAGVSDSLIRLNIGLESVDDLILDLKNAFEI